MDLLSRARRRIERRRLTASAIAMGGRCGLLGTYHGEGMKKRMLCESRKEKVSWDRGERKKREEQRQIVRGS